MKARITSIKEIYNEDFSINCYEIIIDIDKLLHLKLGNCEIKQYETNKRNNKKNKD